MTEYQRTNGGIHAQLHSQKVYFQHDIDEIIKERDEVQSFGHGTADEWQKGLRDKGKEAMTDAMRWESWEHRLRAKGRERAAGAMRSEDGDISLAPGADLTRVIRLYHVSLPPTRRMTQQHPVSAAADGKPVLFSFVIISTAGPCCGSSSSMRLSPLPPGRTDLCT